MGHQIDYLSWLAYDERVSELSDRDRVALLKICAHEAAGYTPPVTDQEMAALLDMEVEEWIKVEKRLVKNGAISSEWSPRVTVTRNNCNTVTRNNRNTVTRNTSRAEYMREYRLRRKEGGVTRNISRNNRNTVTRNNRNNVTHPDVVSGDPSIRSNLSNNIYNSPELREDAPDGAQEEFNRVKPSATTEVAAVDDILRVDP